MTVKHKLTRRSFLNVLGAAGIVTPFGCASLQKSDPDPRHLYLPKGPPVSKKFLIVAMMGDPQLGMTPTTPEHVKAAMNDFAELEWDFMSILGDLVQNQAPLYADYQRGVVEKTSTPIYALAGNADLGAGLESYQKATGLPLWYCLKARGIRFLFTSTTIMTGKHRHICHMGPEQLQWLKTELARDTKSTTVIFSHPPVFETTWHSEERDHLKAPGSMYLAESAEMRELFAQYANIKVFAHGHLHHGYGVVDEFGRSGHHFDNGVLHISVGATANDQGSKFLFVEKDKIIVKSRDHGKKKWLDDLEYVYPIKTTLK